MPWFRRSVVAGLIVAVPLVISVAALVWIFGIIDGFAGVLVRRLLGREVPGIGLVITLLVVVMVGSAATNIVGRRVLARGEAWLMRVPVFKTIYAPVKQLVTAFSPDNEYGFKRVVMVEDPGRGLVMGFLTREFTVTRGERSDRMTAVYVPTNHLYLGDIRLFPTESVFFPDLTVEEGISVFLTGGMSMPGRIGDLRSDDRRKDLRA